MSDTAGMSPVEQPDTAAIRAQYDVFLDVPGNRVIRALCDALDATRAERDAEKRLRIKDNGLWIARAEAAEAELAATYCCDSSDYAGHIHIGPGGCGYQHCHCDGGTPGTWSALEKRAEVAEVKSAEAFQVALLAAYARDAAEARVVELAMECADREFRIARVTEYVENSFCRCARLDPGHVCDVCVIRAALLP